jgi:gas vesicle protein
MEKAMDPVESTPAPKSPSDAQSRRSAGTSGEEAVAMGGSARPVGSGQDATRQAKNIRDAASQAVGAASEKVKSAASELQGEAVDAAQRLADSQKAQGTRFVRSVAKAIDGAADQLGNDAPNLAAHIRDAGNTLEQVARDFDQRSVADLLRSANDLARRQPMTFMAGMAIAGFMLTRFLKSSPPDQFDEAGRRAASDSTQRMSRTRYAGVGDV